MIRLFVIVLACVGASYLIGRVWPTVGAVAFHVGGFGITWLMLVVTGIGVLAYRSTK